MTNQKMAEMASDCIRNTIRNQRELQIKNRGKRIQGQLCIPSHRDRMRELRLRRPNRARGRTGPPEKWDFGRNMAGSDAGEHRRRPVAGNSPEKQAEVDGAQGSSSCAMGCARKQSSCEQAGIRQKWGPVHTFRPLVVFSSPHLPPRGCSIEQGYTRPVRCVNLIT
jgi:hypothetical protein